MGAELDADFFASTGDGAHGGQQPVGPGEVHVVGQGRTADPGWQHFEVEAEPLSEKFPDSVHHARGVFAGDHPPIDFDRAFVGDRVDAHPAFDAADAERGGADRECGGICVGSLAANSSRDSTTRAMR